MKCSLFVAVMLLLSDSAMFWAGLVLLLPFPATSLTTITATQDCLPDQVISLRRADRPSRSGTVKTD